MVVKVTKGQIWDGSISKKLKYRRMYICTKFHAFIIKMQFLHKSATL